MEHGVTLKSLPRSLKLLHGPNPILKTFTIQDLVHLLEKKY